MIEPEDVPWQLRGCRALLGPERVERTTGNVSKPQFFQPGIRNHAPPEVDVSVLGSGRSCAYRYSCGGCSAVGGFRGRPGIARWPAGAFVRGT